MAKSNLFKNNRWFFFAGALLLHGLILQLVGNYIVFSAAAHSSRDDEFSRVNLPKDEIAVKLPPVSAPPPPLVPAAAQMPKFPALLSIPTAASQFKVNMGPSPIENLPASALSKVLSPPHEVSSVDRTASEAEEQPDPISTAPLAARDLKTGEYNGMVYRYFEPHVSDPDKKYPLVMFLHGAGEKGDDNITQLKYPSTYIFVQPQSQNRFPCFYVAPQAPRQTEWFNDKSLLNNVLDVSNSLENAMGIVSDMMQHYPNIDSNRIYLTGLSSGGVGAWNAAALYPNKVAAIVAPSGTFVPALAGPIARAGIPVWSIFSSNDHANIPIWCNQLRGLLNKDHEDMVTTVYDGKSHNTWDRAYTDPNLLPWLFSWTKVDGTPPLATKLQVKAVDNTRVQIGWSINGENRASLHGFNIYRNGAFIKTISTYDDLQQSDFEFSDRDLDRSKSYTYSLGSINRANQEYLSTEGVTATTTNGDASPNIDWIFNLGTTAIMVKFDQDVDPGLFSKFALYSMDNNASVLSAKVLSDKRTLILYTSSLSLNFNYQIKFKGLPGNDGLFLSCRIKADRNLIREYWSNLNGLLISDFPTNSSPDGVDYWSSLEGPYDWFENYAARMRGYVLPSQDGAYTFWVAGADQVQLSLSTDEDPANKAIIATTSRSTENHVWTKDKSQQSAEIHLLAGHAYYFEVLHKVGDAAIALPDVFAVAWQPPGALSPSVITTADCVPYPDLYFTSSTNSSGPCTFVSLAKANGGMSGN